MNFSNYLRTAEVVLSSDYGEVKGLFINSKTIFDNDLDNETPLDYTIYTNLEERLIINTEYERLECGATKLVIIPNCGDYVIKIPFTNSYRAIETDEEDILELDRLCCVDVMEDEQTIYERASSLMKEILLPNIYIGNVGALPIYIQKKIKETCEDVEERTDKIPHNIDSCRYIFRRTKGDKFSSLFLSSLINCYGISKTLSLSKEASYRIDDLHTGNYGYLSNGRPVIFDTGGYNSCEYWR